MILSIQDATYTNPRLDSVWDVVCGAVLATPRKKKIISLQDLWGSLDGIVHAQLKRL